MNGFNKRVVICLDLEWLGCPGFECHLKSEPVNIRTAYDHSKSECVWYSSYTTVYYFEKFTLILLVVAPRILQGWEALL